MGIVKDIKGRKFAFLTALEYMPNPPRKSKWRCICDCGNETFVDSYKLTSGHTTSCGCQSSRHTVGDRNRTHGMSTYTPEYRAWRNIKVRCYDNKNDHYKDYGGRGIKMCDAWLNSFETFLADVGFRPTPQHSLDRYPNNDGDYEAGNVRWATRSQQRRNTRDAVVVEYNGEKIQLTDLCEKIGINDKLVWTRMKRYGWNLTQALSTPVVVGGTRLKKLNNKPLFIPHSFGHINAITIQ